MFHRRSVWGRTLTPSLVSLAALPPARKARLHLQHSNLDL